MRRRDHPSFPSEITCCFLSVLKTLLMPSEPIRALSGVNVPGFPMAGFQLTLYGRIWATPEDLIQDSTVFVQDGQRYHKAEAPFLPSLQNLKRRALPEDAGNNAVSIEDRLDRHFERRLALLDGHIISGYLARTSASHPTMKGSVVTTGLRFSRALCTHGRPGEVFS